MYIQHYKVLVLAGHQPCQDKPLRCQFVAVSALSPSYKASIRVAKKITVAIDKLIWLTRRTPASYSHEQISSIKPPLTVLRCCVWSGPPLQRWDGDTKTWMGLGQLAIPPLSACSQQWWEALAKKTLLTHEERDGELSLVIQLPRQIKTQDIEAYLGSVEQKKAEKGI